MSLKINYALNSTSVILIINFGYKEFDLLKGKNVYKPLRYFTGITINKNEWNSSAKLPLDKSKALELASMKEKVVDVYNYLKLEKSVTPDLLKIELDEKLKNITAESLIKRVRLVDFIEAEILTSTHLKKNSLTAYKTLMNKLLQFEDKINTKIYSNDVNAELYNSFIEETRSQLNRTNSVWTMVKLFKATLKEIARKYKVDVFNPTNELARRHTVQSVKLDTVYISFRQIQKILKYQPFTEKMKNTRMILLTLLFTGCRYSDVFKIKPDEFYSSDGNEFYYCQYISEKTNMHVLVPILKPLLDVITKNNFETAQKISQAKFNLNVKELAWDCSLDHEVKKTYVDSYGKMQFQTKKFHEFVSSHVGRRSFVSNLKSHIPSTTLNKITGHVPKKKEQIDDYDQISLLENAVLFRKQLKRAAEDDPQHFPFELI